MCHLTHQEEKKLKDRFVKKQIEGKRTSLSVVKQRTLGITGHILMKVLKRKNFSINYKKSLVLDTFNECEAKRYLTF